MFYYDNVIYIPVIHISSILYHTIVLPYLYNHHGMIHEVLHVHLRAPRRDARLRVDPGPPEAPLHSLRQSSGRIPIRQWRPGVSPRPIEFDGKNIEV